MTDNDALARELFDHIKHGDAEHQSWLLGSLLSFFATRHVRSTPQPKPRDPPAQDDGDPLAWVDGLSWHQPATRSVMASAKLGSWMSAALDDPAVCDAMKADIREWFSAGEPMEILTAAIAALDRHPAGDDALREENARLRGALRDASVSLWWAARQMKGNCNGGAVDAVNLAAEDASSVAALTGRQG